MNEAQRVIGRWAIANAVSTRQERMRDLAITLDAVFA
jgi:hypothetical protein